MRTLALALACVAAPLLGGCRTSEVVSQAPVAAAPPAVAAARRAYDVVCAGRVAGTVVEFRTTDARAWRHFSVRDAYQHELGMIDAAGRAWRYRPHEEEALWLGTGTVADGARRILELEGAVELVEVALDVLAAEASARADGPAAR